MIFIIINIQVQTICQMNPTDRNPDLGGQHGSRMVQSESLYCWNCLSTLGPLCFFHLQIKRWFDEKLHSDSQANAKTKVSVEQGRHAGNEKDREKCGSKSPTELA